MEEENSVEIAYEGDHEGDPEGNHEEEGSHEDQKSEGDESRPIEINFEEERDTKTYPSRAPPAYLEKGKEKVQALLTVKYGQKNGPIIEKHLHNATLRLIKQRELTIRSSSPEFKLLYAEIAYEVLGSSFTAKQTVSALKEGFFGWNSVKYQPYVDARVIEEMDHTKGMQEGISECPSCHLFLTTTMQRQTRSADEGFTNFVICRNKLCGRVSRTNN
jgi:DNA-directed RNA polymerase subunit M/transcription elongation factor TFIIS